MTILLENVTSSPVVLEGVSPTGTGANSVLKLGDYAIARRDVEGSMLGGWYQAFPPAETYPEAGRSHCRVQATEPLSGYELLPGEVVRVVVRVDLVALGRFDSAVTVKYVQGGKESSQFLPFGWRGTVARNADRIRPGDPPGPGCKRAVVEGSVTLLPF